MLLIELKIMVDKYKIDEEMYRGKLVSYKDVYIDLSITCLLTI
jgi:hypothetical protein